MVAAFLKRTAAIETTGIRLHDGDLEHSLMKEEKIDVHIFFFLFLCSGIQIFCSFSGAWYQRKSLAIT